MLQTTDYVLLQCKLDNGSQLAAAGAQWCAQGPAAMTLYRAAWQAEMKSAYVYGRLLDRAQLGGDDLKILTTLWAQACPSARETRASRLELVFDAPGHSHAEAPLFHYAVEMDPEKGWEDEIARWYDTEHMPGLAAVPGCIHARRLLNRDHGPLSLACYDLVSRETLGSAPWLAVRSTAWSDIARPHFTNTQRTMMEVVA